MQIENIIISVLILIILGGISGVIIYTITKLGNATLTEKQQNKFFDFMSKYI